MVSERRSMLLRPMTTQEIEENVWKHDNYDGVAASEDLATLARAHEARGQLRKSMPLWLGMSVVSGYNLTRMSVLSNTGRIGAIGGLAVGAIMTVNSLRM